MKQGYSATVAARVSGVTYASLDYWARSEFLVPSITQATGSGTKRRYSFLDVLSLRVAHQLRQAGVSLQALRQILDYLRDLKGAEHPLAETRLVVTPSGDVVATVGDGIMSVLRDPGQWQLAVVVDLSHVVDELRRGLETAA